MKIFFLIFSLSLTLVACNSGTEENSNSEDSNLDVEENDEMLSDFENSMNQIREEMEVSADSMLEAMKIEFAPNMDIAERYNNTAPLEFEDQNWDGSFYFLYPEKPEFKETAKDDHTTFTASTIEKGTIYEVSIEDYSELGEEAIDAGFTEFIHNGLVQHMGGTSIKTDYLKTENGSFGIYSCYNYTLGEHTYCTDHVTYGFYDKMVHLIVTSRPKFESESRVLEFINGFEIVP